MTFERAASATKPGVLVATAIMLASTIGIALGGPARADTAPATGTTATVAADALPTVQVDGVVWSQVTVGNTVYATGKFTQTWPAGQSASSTNQTARSNLLAYDITTGALTSFNHTMNGQGLGITASPDGSRVYVVGEFTAVDDTPRSRIAAFDTASGNLVSSFAPTLSNSTAAVTVTDSTVYVGGNFFNASGVARTRLAAFRASDGALLSWAPKADDDQVLAMVLTPDKSRVVIGGKFRTLSGVDAYGLGAVDASTGVPQSYQVNNVIRSDGRACGITSLSADRNQVYGSAFAFGCGNFEGRFAVEPTSGAIRWLNDCHGDTYSTMPIGPVLYSVGHAHDCSALRAFPNANSWHRAVAETTDAQGTNVGPDSYGWNFDGQPAAGLLNWWPTVAAGTFTGQNQGGWSVTGNADYVAIGGEFPSVNGKAQRGLVRFAVRAAAPNKVGPVNSSTLTPSVTAIGRGRVRISWTSTWDQDNARLTYQVLRDGGTTPIKTISQDSTFWQLPSLQVEDSRQSRGSVHTYRIRVVDPLDNAILGDTSSTVVVR